MTTLIITLVILGWIASAIVRTADRKRSEKLRKAANKRTNEWEYRLREAELETKRILAESKAETDRIIALEKAKAEQERWNARMEEKSAKMEAEIRKLGYRMDKAEDEICHFTALLETLNRQRNEAQGEIDRIERNLSAKEIMDEIGSRESKGYKGWRDASGFSADALEFMDASAQHIGDTRTPKQKAADEAKLLKRKETLENRVLTLDNKIFSTEQKIKKAEYEKYEAQAKMEEVA